MKELKDFIHLYLGCMCQYRFLNAMGRVEKREGKLYGIKGSYCFLETNYGFIEERIEDIKLILRPLSDMAEEEKFEGDDVAELTRYLLSKHFDLFGLIPAGLAIDKTTLITKP